MKIKLRQLVPTPSGNAPPSGPHSRYAQIEELVEKWQRPDPTIAAPERLELESVASDASVECDQEGGQNVQNVQRITWIHHSAPREIGDVKKPGEVWVLDVHDNVGQLVGAYEHLKRLPPGHPSRVDPAAWTRWRDANLTWEEKELVFISDPRFDLIVCINESDATTLRSTVRTTNVVYLPFFKTPVVAFAPPTGGVAPFVAFAGGHQASMNGLYGFASEVGTRLEERGADERIRLAVFGGLAEMAKRMGMEQWLRQHRVDVYGAVDPSDEGQVFVGATAAVVLSVIPVGAKTQVVSAMAHGVSPLGMQAIAQSTPLEREWAEEGACETWDEMTDKMIILAAGSVPPPREKVLAALDAFYTHAVKPAEDAVHRACLSDC